MDAGPGRRPARAPDIVTVGWYLADPASPHFRPDVVALGAAGIFAVYGTGSYGPRPGTLVVPGSYPEAFSVGTLDPQDETTNFSGRGPTAWGQIRPDVAAPGAYISSSVPGGGYAAVSASPTGPPHAAGIAALLLEVDPQLGPDALAGLLRTTAIPPGLGEPSNEWGWGRVDATARWPQQRARERARDGARRAGRWAARACRPST
jgi:bacillopeptidase F